MSYVIYKLKNSNDIKFIKFIGTYISLHDAKRIIKENENYDYDELKISEFEGLEYRDMDMIPKFTTIEVSRIPNFSNRKVPKTSKIEFKNDKANNIKYEPLKPFSESLENEKLPDDDKLEMMINSEARKIPVTMMRSNIPPQGYRCHKCNIAGHYIDQCPGVKDQFGNYVDRKTWKLPSGIPRTRLEVAAPDSEGVFLDNTGNYVRFTKDSVNIHYIPQKLPFSAEENPKVCTAVNVIPPEFICNLCNNAILDASQTPCCNKNYCSQCILNKLFDPDGGTNGICPNCTKPIPLVDMLIENNALDIEISKWKLSLKMEELDLERECRNKAQKEQEELSLRKARIAQSKRPQNKGKGCNIKLDDDAMDEIIDSTEDAGVNIITDDGTFEPDKPIPRIIYNKPGYQRNLKKVVVHEPFQQESLLDFDKSFKNDTNKFYIEDRKDSISEKENIVNESLKCALGVGRHDSSTCQRIRLADDKCKGSPSKYPSSFKVKNSYEKCEKEKINDNIRGSKKNADQCEREKMNDNIRGSRKNADQCEREKINDNIRGSRKNADQCEREKMNDNIRGSRKNADQCEKEKMNDNIRGSRKNADQCESHSKIVREEDKHYESRKSNERKSCKKDETRKIEYNKERPYDKYGSRDPSEHDRQKYQYYESQKMHELGNKRDQKRHEIFQANEHYEREQKDYNGGCKSQREPPSRGTRKRVSNAADDNERSCKRRDVRDHTNTYFKDETKRTSQEYYAKNYYNECDNKYESNLRNKGCAQEDVNNRCRDTREDDARNLLNRQQDRTYVNRLVYSGRGQTCDRNRRR